MSKDCYEDVEKTERLDHQARVEPKVLDLDTELFCPCGSCIAKKGDSIIYDQNLHGKMEKWTLEGLERKIERDGHLFNHNSRYTLIFLTPDLETCYLRSEPGTWEEIERGPGYVK